MTWPKLDRIADERFRMHRLRSTSLGGIAAGIVAVGLFEWQLLSHDVWRWDLLAVAVTLVVVKLALLVYFRFTD